MRIGIIGAGPAGMMAALQAAKSAHRICLIDGNQKIGKKLLTTGAGRCNITNLELQSERYHSSDAKFVKSIIERFPPSKFQEHLLRIGIPIHVLPDGWAYPLSNSAANVVDIFEQHLITNGVRLMFNSKVKDLMPDAGGFKLMFSDGRKSEFFHKLILTSGGRAYPNLGSDGNLFPVLDQLGHDVIQQYPALAPLITPKNSAAKMQGLRLDAGVTLHQGDRAITSEKGNIIFTNWGINGPGVMNLSHFVSTAGEKVDELTVEIDFLMDHEAQLREILNNSKKTRISFSAILQAYFPKKLIELVLNQLDISMKSPICELSQGRIDNVIQRFQHYVIPVKGTRGFEYSQVSTGGIPLGQVDVQTMRSSVNENLYFAGEILDVIGPCGGYNLHWAFASGFVAGSAAISD